MSNGWKEFLDMLKELNENIPEESNLFYIADNHIPLSTIKTSFCGMNPKQKELFVYLLKEGLNK